MKKNQILVAAIDAEGVEVVGDALDLDERSFRAFVLGLFWQSGIAAAVDPAELPGVDIPLRLKADAKAVMTLEEAERRNEEAARAAQEAANAPAATSASTPASGVSYDDLTPSATPSSTEPSAG